MLTKGPCYLFNKKTKSQFSLGELQSRCEGEKEGMSNEQVNGVAYLYLLVINKIMTSGLFSH